MGNLPAFRHELKYRINKRDKDQLLVRLREFADYDSHAPNGRYYVRSLYFDDPAGSAFEEKEGGVRSRHKWRIRVYDLDDGFICLEKKVKEGSYIRKESARITRSEYDMIMKGDTDFLLGREEQVARDFALETRIRMLRPEVIVDYDRTPLVYGPGNVRITFDENVRSVFDDLDIFESGSAAYNTMGQDILIMEVKFTEFLPSIFTAILPGDGCHTAASKYVLCDEIKRKMRGY